MKQIYMDHNATTPLDREVLDAMMPYLTEHFGNPSSSTHIFGKIARDAVEEARGKVARLINARDADIVFTSGATESDNMAIKGVAWARREEGNHIITCKVEHKAVLDSCKWLEKEGFQVTYLPVDRYAMVDPDDVRKAITDKTVLVSIMHANSEVGTIEPIKEIGEITSERGVAFHCDAVQAVGKIPVDVENLKVDFLSISGHKIYGPKGVGALYIRKRVKMVPLMTGGGQERQRRSGTLNVPGIVGLGKACETAMRDMEKESRRLVALRTRLLEGIMNRIDHVYLNGHPENRIPNNLNLSFDYVEGEGLIMSLKNVAVSSGSACTSQTLEPSYVLRAMGIPDATAHSSVRFGLGKSNSEEDVDYVIDLLEKGVRRLRAISPLV
ncbi:MAG: cysteine desulfurase NifS [Acidobacteriota bacterium]